MTPPRIGFIRWTSASASGGNRYDDALAAGLRELGINLREHEVTGSWPLPTASDRAPFGELLNAEEHWLVPNIVATGAPEQINAALQAGRRITLLMHYFPEDDIGLPQPAREQLGQVEAQLAHTVTRVVVTSQWAAAEVASRYGRDDAVVAQPGVEPAEIAPGRASAGEPPILLWLGRISTAKDPMTFVQALAQVRDLEFTARLVGPGETSDFAQTIRERIEQAGLADRVHLLGQQHDRELEHTWAATDLLMHSSPQETYGMVVAEALAHGIASIVAAGTGAVEAQQRVGATFPPGDASALAAELRRWLTDEHLRNRWRRAAIAAREHRQTWADTARAVASNLDY